MPKITARDEVKMLSIYDADDILNDFGARTRILVKLSGVLTARRKENAEMIATIVESSGEDDRRLHYWQGKADRIDELETTLSSVLTAKADKKRGLIDFIGKVAMTTLVYIPEEWDSNRADYASGAYHISNTIIGEFQAALTAELDA